ncbi:MAG: phosphoribosylglycinamide formyltransferase [Coriobacteriia bacterium]|nr:phosphoribosylglycinamide formyltransferase [Coriobacteriia bacterium]
MRVGVLISGGGTNLQAILDAADDGRLDAEVAVVVGNHADAYGLTRAENAGVAAVFLDRAAFPTPRAYNDALLETLHAHHADVVAMAGYMRLLGRRVLEAYPERVLNIHPALLPAFPGPAGIHDAFEHGVKVTGVTVHFASERFDEGPIIAQEAVRVAEDDTVESLEARIHEVEHALYPRVLQLLAEDRLVIEGRRVRIG